MLPSNSIYSHDGGMWGVWWGCTNTPIDILPEGSARCVQSFDDSLNFAFRIKYRISLRSSSMWEPRHPLLKVMELDFARAHLRYSIEGFGYGWNIMFREIALGVKTFNAGKTTLTHVLL